MIRISYAQNYPVGTFVRTIRIRIIFTPGQFDLDQITIEVVMTNSKKFAFNKKCLLPGLKAGITSLNMAVIELLKRSGQTPNIPVRFSPYEFNLLIGSYVPYASCFIDSLKGKEAVETKKVFPNAQETLDLLTAYADGDSKTYTALEDKYMERAKVKDRLRFMENVIAVCYIAFVIRAFSDRRIFTYLSYLLPGEKLRSYLGRFEKPFENQGKETPEEKKQKGKDPSFEKFSDEQIHSIWKIVTLPSVKLHINPNLETYIQHVIPYLGKNSFPMEAIHFLPSLNDYISSLGIKVDTRLNGITAEFTKEFCKEEGILTTMASSGRNPYLNSLPKNLPYKEFINELRALAIQIAYAIRKRFKLSYLETGAFTVYALIHIPAFNLLSARKNTTKSSKYVPAVVREDGIPYVIFNPNTLAHFTMRHIKNGSVPLPVEQAPQNSDGSRHPSSFNAQSRYRALNEKSFSIMDHCSKAFLTQHGRGHRNNHGH